MKILVTGGTGFIGSNLAKALVDQGHEVIITGSDPRQKVPWFKGKCINTNFLGIDYDSLGKVDAVFHQAAINDTQYFDKDEMFRVNVEWTKNLFEELYKRGCRKFVYATSTAVYGTLPIPHKVDGPVQPMNPYSESKLEVEKFAQEFSAEKGDVSCIGLRYCNVYGPGESRKGKRSTMVYQLMQNIKKGDVKLFKMGEQARDYIYVKDVVRANLKALDKDGTFVVNCGSGAKTSFNDIVKILNQVSGLNRKIEYIDNPFEGNYQAYTQCDMSCAKEKLGFVPEYSIEEGIKDYYESGFLGGDKLNN